MEALLHVHEIGRSLKFVLDDPLRQNALSAEMVGEIESALDAAAPGLAALVIEGANGVFSAGASAQIAAERSGDATQAGRG